MRLLILTAVLAGLLTGGPARAQEGPVVSFGASTLGATLEMGYRVSPDFGLRGIAGFGNMDFATTFSGAPVQGNANIGGYGVLGDIYLGGGVRLSAGAVAPGYGAEMSITGDITIDGNTVNNVDIAASLSSTNQFAPMLAIGYEKTYRNNWGISADIGAMYTGGFSLSATDNSAQITQADLDAELADTNAELGQIIILPYIKLGVSFQF